MSSRLTIPSARELPADRLATRREQLVAEIARPRSRGAAPPRRVIVLAAVALVALGTASGFAARELLVLDRGFIGLPPDGAAPSAPEDGELVVSYWGRNLALNNEFRRVWVYADGRVIWYRTPESVAPGASPLELGFLERRLTPEGVELVRSEFLATGLFGHDRELVGGPSIGAWAQVRDGDRLVQVAWNAAVYPAKGPAATEEQVNALRRIDYLAADLDAWLPASAWGARKARAYVASKYAFCSDSDLTLLPEPVQALLHGHEFVWKASPWIQQGCAVVPTDAARAIDRALAAAGLEAGDGPGKNDEGYRQVYRLPGVASSGLVGYVFFEPMLPHGEWVCTPCG